MTASTGTGNVPLLRRVLHRVYTRGYTKIPLKDSQDRYLKTSGACSFSTCFFVKLADPSCSKCRLINAACSFKSVFPVNVSDNETRKSAALQMVCFSVQGLEVHGRSNPSFRTHLVRVGHVPNIPEMCYCWRAPVSSWSGSSGTLQVTGRGRVRDMLKVRKNG